MRLSILAASLLALAGSSAQAASLSTYYAFNSSSGYNPYGGLTIDAAGNLFGTTSTAGPGGQGIVFKVSPTKVLTTLVAFNGANGATPEGTLTLDKAGNLYGTTLRGGAANDGTVFKIGAAGGFTTLASFSGTNGRALDAGVLLDRTGNLYGVTRLGGTAGRTGLGDVGLGTVFKLDTAGHITTLVNFGGPNGAYPYGELISDAAGNLYGTTLGGPSNVPYPHGTVFKVAPGGALTTLTTFTGQYGLNGTSPYAGLVADTAGNLYGTTSGGGSGLKGTVFKISAAGAFTTLANFNGANGTNPELGPLILDAAGNLFGTTYAGGAGPNGGLGTVFKVSAAGVLSTIADFNNSGQQSPYAGLVADGSGNLFGTAFNGGGAGGGAIYEVKGSGFVPFPVGGTVPELATWALMLIGFGAVGAAARSRRPALG